MSATLNAVIDHGKFRVADGLLVDLNPLIHTQQVRRGVKARAIAGGLHDAGERCSGGSLAVGAGNQDALQLALRIAQRLSQPPHVHKIKLAVRRQLMAKGQQIVYRRFVCRRHSSGCLWSHEIESATDDDFMSLR